MAASRAEIAAVRFGYGFRPGEDGPANAGALMASLAPGAAFDAIGGPSLDERIAQFRRFETLRKANKNNANRPKMEAVRKRIKARHQADIRARTMASVISPHGFFERLAWFWSDHFSLSGKGLIGKVVAGRYEADAIRPYLAGPFRRLLRAAATHPAMLHYLDQDRAMGPASAAGRRRGRGLNENLAREVIELHTLGVGAAYDQDDVRQFAELLTGIGVDRNSGLTTFRPGQAEPGAEQVLGESYGGGAARLADIYAALDDLAAHPATARHIARKLATHFVADEPSAALVSHMELAFKDSDGDLSMVYAAMLAHEESWARFGEKVRQPFDFTVAALRASGPQPDEIAALRDAKEGFPGLMRPLQRMGQAPMNPPGPQGWPEDAASWITPQGLAARIDWASRLGRAVAARRDPREFLSTALGGIAGRETRFAATNAAERWEGIALVLASPEFNRR
ncbi:MAG: DUF1800 domain-containing protein [Paracoccaceae bacterium]